MTGSLLFSHPTGNANVRAVLTGLFEAEFLKEFHTTVASYPGNIWDKIGRTNWGNDFNRRKFDERLELLTVQHPFRELGRIAANRLNLRQLTRHEIGFFSIDAVNRTLDKTVARYLRKDTQSFTAVYAYEDGSIETFRAAHDLGIRCFYDLPIAYWKTAQKLLYEEAERLPTWEPTLGGTRDSTTKLERKAQEMALADVVICPSQFVANSLPQSAQTTKKIIVALFGSPPASKKPPREAIVKKKLRVLFAGSMSQRKGLGDLLVALQILNRNDVELVILGSLQTSMEFYRKEFNGFTYEPPRPHAQVLELMRSCDVFCLPSIVEGRALVMQEAMSQGLPLIITPNTGGEDLIDEGKTGFLIPIRRADKIAEKIAWFADNRVLISEMSQAAKTKASQLTWESYQKIIVDAVRTNLR
jgi:glycosyltransferase involved in cell wall biosynthesis